MFGSFVSTDKGDSSRYVLYLSQGGLGLPDESYYSDERFAQVRDDIEGTGIGTKFKRFRREYERNFSLNASATAAEAGPPVRPA